MTAQPIETIVTKTTAPQHGAEVFVPLNQLKASPKNARKAPHSTAAIEALAASIKAKGVLQPPVVEVEVNDEGVATGNYLVTIGEGRRQALRLLAKRKAIKRTHPVRVIVDADNDAHEISLDENITREAMHPADQFEAFRRLAEEKGYGAEEIGARFGVSAQLVRQRLRLGAAAPELMTAYREGGLALDQLMAFCVSDDVERQRQVFEQMISETDSAETLPPEVDARLEEIDRTLQAFGPDFDYPVEVKARAGVMVLLGHDGLARFERGLIRAEDTVSERAPDPEAPDGFESEAGDEASKDAGRRDGDAEPQDELAPLSERLILDLTAHRTMGLRDAVQADADIALSVVVHALVLQTFYPGYGDWSVLQLRLQTSGLDRVAPGVSDGPAGRRVADRCETWGVRLPEKAEGLWSVVIGLSRDEHLDLLATCAGVGVLAVRDPRDRRPGVWGHAETLATAVGLDMTGTWSATAASYFSRVAKARVLEAVTEATGAEEAARIAGFKKGDMADAAERLLEGKGWLPPLLRTAPAAVEAEAEEGEPTATDDAYPFAAE